MRVQVDRETAWADARDIEVVTKSEDSISPNTDGTGSDDMLVVKPCQSARE